jgi:hypothetical protein
VSCGELGGGPWGDTTPSALCSLLLGVGDSAAMLGKDFEGGCCLGRSWLSSPCPPSAVNLEEPDMDFLSSSGWHAARRDVRVRTAWAASANRLVLGAHRAETND